MGELNVEYPCGHKITAKFGAWDFGGFKFDGKNGCPLHGKKCGVSNAKN
jgi:hypothetical protein